MSWIQSVNGHNNRTLFSTFSSIKENAKEMGNMAMFFVVCISDNCYNQIILPRVRSGAWSGVWSARAGARVSAALSLAHARRNARPGQGSAPQTRGAPAGRAGARVPCPLEAAGRGGARVQHGAAAHQLAGAAGRLDPGARSRGHGGLARAGGWDVGAALTE